MYKRTGKKAEGKVCRKGTAAVKTGGEQARALASGVKGIEELFLTRPMITLEQISRSVLGSACSLTGSRSGFAGYMDPGTGWLIAASLTNRQHKNPKVKGGPFSSTEFNGLWHRVLKANKPLMLNSLPLEGGKAVKRSGGVRIGRFLGAPALAGRRQFGILALANPGRAYSAADLEAVKQLARVYAMILKRKLAEDTRRKEYDGLLAILSSSQDIIYSADMEGKIVYASPRVKTYGYKPEELVGSSIFELVHPQDREYIVNTLAKARNTGHTLPMLSYRMRKKNGGYFYMEQKSGIILSGGVPALITGVVRDVGRKISAAVVLKESEETLHNIFETTKDAMYIKDLSGRYIKLNTACGDMLLLKPETALGRTDAEIFSPEAVSEEIKDDLEVVRTGRTISRTVEKVLPSGKYYFNTVKTPLRNARKQITGVLGVVRDITKLKEMESELASFRAADAMSKVAAPLAHDFNNALAVINGHATLIDEDVNASGDIKSGVEHIINAVRWATELTSRFQYFARHP